MTTSYAVTRGSSDHAYSHCSACIHSISRAVPRLPHIHSSAITSVIAARNSTCSGSICSKQPKYHASAKYLHTVFEASTCVSCLAMMLVSKSAHGNAHIRGEAQQRIGHALAQQSARKKVPQSVAQWLLPFSHTVTPPSSSRLRTPAVLDLQPCAEGLSTKYENLLNK